MAKGLFGEDIVDPRSSTVSVDPYGQNTAAPTIHTDPTTGQQLNPATGKPYTTGPGVTTGQAQPQMEGLDISKQGPAEAYYAGQAPTWQTPSFGEVNNQGLVGQYSDPNNRPDLTNNSQHWFDQFSSSMPNIAMDPGLAPYYENAKNRAGESINKSAAATGSYGASSANDQTARAFTDLEADRAQHEADYNLRRLGEQRAWQGLGGQLGGQADQQGNAISADEANWVNLLSRLGIDASQLGLQRTNAGMDAALGAQGAQERRGQDFFNNELAAGDRFNDQYLRVMLPGFADDADLLAAQTSGGIAQGNQGLANEGANAATASSALQTGLGIYTDPNASWNKPKPINYGNLNGGPITPGGGHVPI